MTENLIQLNASVATVLQDWPNAAKIFLKHGTACVGCYLVRFCALDDVITTYQLNKSDFLDDLEKVSNNIISA